MNRNTNEKDKKLKNSFKGKNERLYFDIGANIGMWSLKNIKNKNCKKTIAVEPSMIAYKTLVENCKGKAIKCLNYAVSNENKKEIKFYECESEKYNQLSTLNKDWLCSKKSRFYGTEYIEKTCDTIKLDQLIEVYGIPDLIKIDVEGLEDLVISSLTKKIKTLCFEWVEEFPLVTENSINHLVKIGFTKFYTTKKNEPHRFSPKEKEYTEDLEFIKTTIKKIKEECGRTSGMIWAK